MKELVKYDNYLNSLNFKGFTATDFNFFMYLCASMRDKGVEEMSFEMSDICECVKYQHKGTIEEYCNVIDNMNDKLLSMKAKVETETELSRFLLFSTFTINKKTGTLTVSVNKKFQYLLNELTKNFTQFELAEFTELSSKYSKTLYRLLKQYRSTGQYYVGVDELRTLLGCPESYPNKMFMLRIITPAVKELQKDFPTLSCEPQRARTKGRPIVGYHFTFEADGQVPGQMTMDQAAEVMKQYTETKKSKQNKKTMPRGLERDYDYADLERQLLQKQGM